MDKEELLKEAKLRYPIGTVFKDAWQHIEYVCDDDLSDPNKNSWFTDKFLIIWAKDKMGNRITNQGKYLFFENKWAEIVSYPENYIPSTESILKNVIIW